MTVAIAMAWIVSIDKAIIKSTLSKQVENGTYILRLVAIVHLILIDVSDVSRIGRLVKIVRFVLVN